MDFKLFSDHISSKSSVCSLPKLGSSSPSISPLKLNLGNRIKRSPVYTKIVYSPKAQSAPSQACPISSDLSSPFCVQKKCEANWSLSQFIPKPFQFIDYNTIPSPKARSAPSQPGPFPPKSALFCYSDVV